ncbi:MAG: oligopeptide/dipeptide ABC transporter ATP-binding protein [Thermodesulfobacteriota bacterium]|nr:oligopeptide/dipeptide ABC transporter ATP-binding protein [Thermodesulfobacteriota bacterium]
MPGSKDLIIINNLKKYFTLDSGFLSSKKEIIKAVDGVSFTIKEKETIGLVGESGCGKTTTGKLLIRLIEPTTGHINYEGEDIFTLTKNRVRELRKKMQFIFQDPYSSLNPRMNVGSIVGEGLKVHKILTTRARRKRVEELLMLVGLRPQDIQRYPHEFSGGQRQRIGIARAISLNPSFLIADEPISALDVSIQAQILNLLLDLKRKLGLTLLFISHDLHAVKFISDRIIVMYKGKIVEIADCEEIFKNPSHPYTRFLLSAVLQIDPGKRKKREIFYEPEKEVFNKGCSFLNYCKEKKDRCYVKHPDLTEKAEGHFVACHCHCPNLTVRAQGLD